MSLRSRSRSASSKFSIPPGTYSRVTLPTGEAILHDLGPTFGSEYLIPTKADVWLLSGHEPTCGSISPAGRVLDTVATRYRATPLVRPTPRDQRGAAAVGSRHNVQLGRLRLDPYPTLRLHRGVIHLRP